LLQVVKVWSLSPQSVYPCMVKTADSLPHPNKRDTICRRVIFV
jgi:hypothetical protein